MELISIRTLAVDIETSPSLAHVWQLWNINNISLAQLQESSTLMCFSAKWFEDDEVLFYSEWQHGHAEMVRKAHELLTEADVVAHYNGKRFDVPYLNKEFILAGYSPPAPYMQVDLYQAVKRRFKFPSNKLDYVSKALGLGGKVSHEGHELWVKVLAGDADARSRMQEYNEQDTILVEQLYNKILPWIPSHPNHALIDGEDGFEFACTKCKSKKLARRSDAYTAQSSYPRYQCLKCGNWLRGTKRINGTTVREVA